MINHDFHGLPFGLIAFSISAATFWPYFGGAAILIIGVAMFSRSKFQHAGGFGPLILVGPVLFAIPMAIFGMDHLVAAKAVSTGVPSWIPGHLFWAYFVGVALIAAALSLATQIQSRMASALLGIMIFIFVLLIHIPSCFAIPYDKTRLTIVFRDSALSAGALAFAASSFEQGGVGGTRGWPANSHLQNVSSKLIVVARLLIAISIGVFGIDHFLYPTFAPGIPQEGPTFVTMPSWIPGHALWAYLTGTIFVACAGGLATRKYARFAATVLGSTVLVLALFVYLPLTIAKASDVANGLNYLAIHFALAGSVLLLAGSLPAVDAEYADAYEVERSSFRRVSDS
ncbi:MAG TPA: hypothetical protein VJP02_02500 [Candidatus Sulfotelmatobacter sp.]|nr:hypothetical protein [Candidatus Sulfotelmatobacter sp.]